MAGEKIWLFDTTLRDGGQTRGVDFSRADKIAIAEALDAIGIDYVEAGWPGANPTDDAFFGAPPRLKKAKLVAFGMTRRGGRSTANDPGLSAVIDAKVDAACLVGKTWDFHVNTALNISMDENLKMISILSMIMGIVNLVLPLISKVSHEDLIRAKVNLYTKTPEHIITGFHIDQDEPHKVLLYSVNTNNGYTLFENGDKVPSVANQAVIFDGHLKHSSVTQTDENIRVTININYK